MIDRVPRVKRLVTLLAIGCGLLLIPAPVPAEPKPAKQDAVVTQMVCEFLKQGHLSQPEIGDEISKRLFKRFLKELDPNKVFFLKSDIDEFRKFETELDDQLLAGDLSFAYKVYDRLLMRVGERQTLVKEFVATPHDYTVNEFLETDPDTLDYAASADEMRERWRKRIKFDLLMQRLGEKPVEEAEAKKKVLTRYESQVKRWKQVDNSDLLEIYPHGVDNLHRPAFDLHVADDAGGF